MKSNSIHDFKGIGFSKIGHFKEVRSKIKELEKLNITSYIVKPMGALEFEGVILNALNIKLPDPDITANAQQRAIRIPSRSLKILLAEDTPFNQKFIMRLLERWNHQAVLVENGHQALKTIRKEK